MILDAERRAFDTERRASDPSVPRRGHWYGRAGTGLLVLADVVAVVVALLLCLWVYRWLIDAGVVLRSPPDLERYALVGAVHVGLCVTLLAQGGAYRLGSSVLHLNETRAIARGTLVSAACVFALLFLARQSEGYSRIVLLSFVTLSPLAILIERRLMVGLFQWTIRSTNLGRRVLIYGAGGTGLLVMKKAVQTPAAGLKVVGFVDDYAPVGTPLRCRLRQGESPRFTARVLGRGSDLESLLRTYAVDYLLVTASNMPREVLDRALRAAGDLRVEVGLVPRIGDLRVDQLKHEDISAIPIMSTHSHSGRWEYAALKRLVDVVLATVILAATLPGWVAAAIAIRLDTEGPVFFRQDRVGQGGRAFRMFKFRTMAVSADPYAYSPQGNRDPRITRTGRWLRMTGFDEVPQLLNVLIGDMSIVGPRPEMPFIVRGYSDLERQRLRVKPGITGLWQLSPDRDAQIHENIEYDLYYVRSRSVLLDGLILMETLVFTLGILTRRAFGLDRPRPSDPAREAAVLDPKPKTATQPDGYVLIALDQRRRAREPMSWLRCLPALPKLATNTYLKVLVASENVAAMDALLETGAPPGEPAHLAGLSVHQVEMVPYRNRTDLENLVLGADLVLTDLQHVRSLSREGSVDVLYLEGEQLLWARGAKGVDSLVGELSAVLQGATVS